MSAPRAMYDGQRFEIWNNRSVRIGPDHFRFDYFFCSDYNPALGAHGTEFIRNATCTPTHYIPQIVGNLSVNNSHISAPRTHSGDLLASKGIFYNRKVGGRVLEHVGTD